MLFALYLSMFLADCEQRCAYNPGPPMAEMTTMSNLDTELEAAAFRRLVSHLQGRTDVQNIDLMNLAGFCRNCLARWYEEEASARGVEMTREAARERVYGMPYEEWKTRYQR
jgi:hypothetical protein